MITWHLQRKTLCVLNVLDLIHPLKVAVFSVQSALSGFIGDAVCMETSNIRKRLTSNALHVPTKTAKITRRYYQNTKLKVSSHPSFVCSSVRLLFVPILTHKRHESH